MIDEPFERFSPESWGSLEIAFVDNGVHLSDFIVGENVLYDEVAFEVYLKSSRSGPR